MIDRAVIFATSSPSHQSYLASNRPRAMLPVLGKPLVARTMERLHRAGIHHFTVVIGEQEGAVAAYLNEHWLTNVSVEFAMQSAHGGMYQTLQPIISQHNEPFILTTYNSLTHPNFAENLLSRYQDNAVEELVLCAGSTTLSNSPPADFALVENQQVTGIVHEKPEGRALLLINLALCGLEFAQFITDAPPSLTHSRKSLMDIFRDYLQAGGKVSIAESAWVLPVETDDDLLTVNKLLLTDGQDTHILSEIPRNVQIVPPVRIDPHVSVGTGAKIGPNVYLEAGCSVGPNATVANTVVLQNGMIPAGSVISDAVIASNV